MPDRHQFYRIEICSRIFIGTVCADGPYLKMVENRAYDHRVPLGSALEILKPVGRQYYAICKNNEPRIVLPMFDEEEIDTVSRAFGIPITGRLQGLSFTKSPAWYALRRWVTQHPEIARACSRKASYVPGWQHLDTHSQSVEGVYLQN